MTRNQTVVRIMPLAAILLSALLTGCVGVTVGPSKTAMRQQLMASQTRATYTVPSPVPEKLAMTDAKKLALAQNPGLSAIEARIRGAEMRLRRSYSAFFPQISASARATHHKLSPTSQVFGGTTFNSKAEPYETYDGSITASWLLFDGFVREFNTLSARADVESAAASKRDAQRLLANSVAQSFLSALLAQKRMQIAQADQTFNQSFLNETQKRLDQGSATRAEVLNFQIRLDNARITYLEAQNDYRISLVVLAELMGYPGLDLSDATKLVVPELTIQAPPSLSEALSTALNSRPDLDQIMSQIRSARAKVKAGMGAYYPTFSVDGTWGGSDPNFDWDTNDQTLYWGANLNWLLYDGGARRYSIEEAKAAVNELDENLRRQWQSVVSEIRQEIENLKTTASKVTIEQQIVQSTETIRGDVEKAYKAGQETLTRLNEAQRDLIVANERLASQQIEYLLARENLAASTGSNN